VREGPNERVEDRQEIVMGTHHKARHPDGPGGSRLCPPPVGSSPGSDCIVIRM
jgi:hypothetical protein